MCERRIHMKQENTVRNTIVKSIRLTPDECARIEGMAKQSNMSFNSYVVRTALEPFHSEYSPQFYCYLRHISTILRTPQHMLTQYDINCYNMEADFICRTLLNL